MMTVRRLVAYSVLGLILVGETGVARAGGFTIPLIGGRASTKLAFVAKPDDTSAVYHNPAGLSLLGPYQIDLSGTAILSYSRYTRCSRSFDPDNAGTLGCFPDSAGGNPFAAPVESVKYGAYPRGFGILPYLGMSGRFGLKRWNFALAIYSPQNATGAFPDCERGPNGEPLDCSMAPQRFHAQLGTINTLYITPSAAYEPHPGISIGVGVSAVRAAITLDRSLWLGGPTGSAALFGWDGEGRVHLEANGWSWAFNAGLIWHVGKTFPKARAVRGLRIGFSYQHQTKFAFADTMSLYSPALRSLLQENEGCVQGDAATYEVRCKATADFIFPIMVRFGLNWELTEEWDVGLDVFWQNYKTYKEIAIKFPRALELSIGDTSVTGTAEPKNSKDVWALALGVQYSPKKAKGLEVRAGVMLDQSPYPDNTYTLLNPDADKIGLALGVSYLFKFGLELGAGYIALIYRDRIIRDSIIVPHICEPGDADCQTSFPDAPFSMNGDVKNKIVHLWAFHVGWRFGGGKPSLEPKPTPAPSPSATPAPRRGTTPPLRRAATPAPAPPPPTVGPRSKAPRPATGPRPDARPDADLRPALPKSMDIRSAPTPTLTPARP